MQLLRGEIMRKIFVFIAVLTLMFNNTNIYSFASENDEIRIGLEYRYKDVSNIPINDKIINVGFEYDSEFQLCGTVEFSNSVTARASDNYYLKINDDFNNYRNAFNKANDIDNAIVALEEKDSWAVYIGGYSSEEKAKETKNKLAIDSEIIKASSLSISLYSDSKQVLVLNNQKYCPQIYSDNNSTILGNRAYRGRIQLNRNLSLITAINIVSVDEYLYSVVPSEMPSNWPKEALKAQAVVSRNYAISQISASKHNDYDLCDSVHCQVYKGIENENDRSTSAVKETDGIMAYYDGEIINAVFHSSSGGYTDNSENVWSKSVPYLRGVKEINETEGKSWTRTFTLSELTEILNKNNCNIGNASSVFIKSTATGRVISLVIVGTNGSKTLEKEEIRTFFSYSSDGSLESRNFTIANGSAVNQEKVESIAIDENDIVNTQVYVVSKNKNNKIALKNSVIINSEGDKNNVNYSISAEGKTKQKDYYLTSVQDNDYISSEENVNTITSTGNTVTFVGKGWGHGVGMSQYGAKGMAEKGYTYDKILKHYYTGIDLY